MKREPWDTLDYRAVREHYDRRCGIHQRLADALQRSDIHTYVELALGIEEAAGNYSATEHCLGPKILAESPEARVFELAQRLFVCQVATEIPEIIYGANIPYLKIGVGSEMAALLRPEVFWVTNVRTIWAHLVIKHHSNVGRANEELHYYQTQKVPSEMDYPMWRDIHPLVGASMEKLADIGSTLAGEQGIVSGDRPFLWADAIADAAYAKYSK